MTERFIALTQGLSTLIDTHSREGLLDGPKWFAHKPSPRSSWYAARKVVASTNSGVRIQYMHRLLMGEPADQQVDHRNGDSLDNRISNLRLASNTENSRNARLGKNNTSGYKGVTWDASRQQWRAQIMVNKKNLFLGRFDNTEESALAYNQAALHYHGEFAVLNTIQRKDS